MLLHKVMIDLGTIALRLCSWSWLKVARVGMGLSCL